MRPTGQTGSTRRRAVAAALLLTGLSALQLPLGTAQAQTAPQQTATAAAPESVLWVGNSFFYYNNSLHGHFGRLVASAGGGARVRGVSATISGSGLDWHDMASLLRPDGLSRYSFVGDNEIRFNPPGRPYDTVVMMDCSQCPIHPQLQAAFHDTVKKNAQLLRQAGVRPVLFMSWAYQDKPEMTAQLAEQYTLAGTYLAACTAYATLFGKSPVGLAYSAGLPTDLAARLQTAAWEAVQAYAAR